MPTLAESSAFMHLSNLHGSDFHPVFDRETFTIFMNPRLGVLWPSFYSSLSLLLPVKMPFQFLPLPFTKMSLKSVPFQNSVD